MRKPELRKTVQYLIKEKPSRKNTMQMKEREREREDAISLNIPVD